MHLRLDRGTAGSIKHRIPAPAAGFFTPFQKVKRVRSEPLKSNSTASVRLFASS